jgi:hypothetical protein
MTALFPSCGHYLRLGRGLKAKPLGRTLCGLDPAPGPEFWAPLRGKQQSEQLLSYGGSLPGQHALVLPIRTDRKMGQQTRTIALRAHMTLGVRLPQHRSARIEG